MEEDFDVKLRAYDSDFCLLFNTAAVVSLKIVKSWEYNVNKPRIQEFTSTTRMSVHILPIIFHLVLQIVHILLRIIFSRFYYIEERMFVCVLYKLPFPKFLAH